MDLSALLRRVQSGNHLVLPFYFDAKVVEIISLILKM